MRPNPRDGLMKFYGEVGMKPSRKFALIHVENMMKTYGHQRDHFTAKPKVGLDWC